MGSRVRRRAYATNRAFCLSHRLERTDVDTLRSPTARERRLRLAWIRPDAGFSRFLVGSLDLVGQAQQELRELDVADLVGIDLVDRIGQQVAHLGLV